MISHFQISLRGPRAPEVFRWVEENTPQALAWYILDWRDGIATVVVEYADIALATFFKLFWSDYISGEIYKSHYLDEQ